MKHIIHGYILYTVCGEDSFNYRNTEKNPASMNLTPKQTKPPTFLDKLIQTKLKKKDSVLEETLEAAVPGWACQHQAGQVWVPFPQSCLSSCSEIIQEKNPQTFFFHISLGTLQNIDWQKMCWEGLRKKTSQTSVTMFQTEMNTKAMYSRKDTGKKVPVSCKAL